MNDVRDSMTSSTPAIKHVPSSNYSPTPIAHDLVH
jgi:hypothetical protein